MKLIQKYEGKAGDRYKYAHIFLHFSTGCNLRLVELICDPDNRFDVNEHLFVTGFKPLYDAVKDKCHIEWCENPGHKGLDMVSLYGERADWLIVHSFPGKIQGLIFYVNKKYLSKMLWRTWGHDVGVDYVRFWNRNPIKDFLLWIYSVGCYEYQKISCIMAKSRLQKLHAVGIANVIDAINIKEYYGLTKTCFMPYPEKNSYELLQAFTNEKRDDKYYHVMIGHSGFAGDKHCEIMDMLKPYEHEKLIIHLILAYGQEDYMEKVIKYATDSWNGRIEIFKKMLDFKEYAKYMNKMDAVILDGTASYALGNLGMILFWKKKLFLNRNGALQKGLTAENIHFHYTDEIPNMSFEEFSAKEEYTVPNDSMLMEQPYETYVEEWRKIFRELDCANQK